MKTAPEKEQTYPQVRPNPYHRAIPWLFWSGFLGITIMGGWIGYEKYFQRSLLKSTSLSCLSFRAS